MHPLLVILAVLIVFALFVYYAVPLAPRPLNFILTLVAVILAGWVILAVVGVVPPLR